METFIQYYICRRNHTITIILKSNIMIKLIYKRNKIKLDDEFIKVYSVINKETNKTLGYIENDEDFGWRFFESIDHDWFGGLETLKETKQWLESFNSGVQIITKITK